MLAERTTGLWSGAEAASNPSVVRRVMVVVVGV